ncbi:metallophosphoesterase [Paenibacillus ottowii]|uniref:metallophosphoesterase n=1 Tax=Paenibacillus ottowii TaxID=2315729 RepID=UPI0013905CC2
MVDTHIETLTDISLKVLNKRLANQKNPNFQFVFLGDTWFDWGNAILQSFTKAKQDAIRRYQIFLSCLDKASKQKPKPLFILYGGDGVFSGSAEQLMFFKNAVEKFVRKTNIAFFMVPGNHERNGVNGSLVNYQNIIGPRKGNKTVQENGLNYIINTPKLRMVMLNDVGPVAKPTRYGITNSALATFNKGINTKKDVVVVMHVPPKAGSFKSFPSSEAFPVTTPNDKAFIANLSKSKSVKLILVSHIHDILLKGTIAGKTAVLNGNGGAGTDTRPTLNPVISSFTFINKNKSIRFDGQRSVTVNTKIRPRKVFILTKDGIISVPIV